MQSSTSPSSTNAALDSAELNKLAPAVVPMSDLPMYQDRLVQVPRRVRPLPLTLQDFECVRTLGSGSFGSVLLVRSRARDPAHPMDRPGSLYALKVMTKTGMRHIDKSNGGDFDSERKTLSALPWSPWVDGAFNVFHDKLNVYLLLECIPAGVLHDLIYQHGPLDASTARFYYANIACALEFIHGQELVHRDLKPANILVKPDGYLCLADFGLTNALTNVRLGNMIGTPVYMAPELLSATNPTLIMSHGVDWYSSGVILYEMVTKRVPFYGKDQLIVYHRKLEKKFKWPKQLLVGHSLKSLVTGLLTFESLDRLGVRDTSEVLEHPWLSGIEWVKMQAHSYLAPWVPGEVDPTQTWQNKDLPLQENLPEIKIVAPPTHLKYDHRLPQEKEEKQRDVGLAE